MKHLTTSFVACAAALAAITLPASAQTTLTGLGITPANLTITDISSDGTAVVGITGSQSTGSIYLWTTTNPTFTLISAVGNGGNCDVSNGGAYISATLPNPANGNAITAARWSASSGQWTFLPGLLAQSGTSLSSASDISADGQAICGLGWITASKSRAYRWDPVNGTVDLGALNPLSNTRADGISADGNTITGFDSDPGTGVWRATKWVGGVESLIGCLNPVDPINGPSQGYAVSADGTYVVGESSTGISTPQNWNENHAWRWDAVNGQIDIGTTPVDPFGWGNHSTVPTGVSADGRTVVGFSGINQPGTPRPMFIWREGSGMFLIKSYLVSLGVPQAASWTISSVAGISADGRVLCGAGRNASNVSEPWMVVLAPTSETYCTAKTNSLGCTPAMNATGIASVTSNLPFTLGASNVINNRSGLLYYGFTTLGAPFQGGIKCIAAPNFRTPIQDSAGSVSGDDCTGTYAFDFNALIQSNTNAQLIVGAKVFTQYWTRDPQASFTTGLTDAVSFTIFP